MLFITILTSMSTTSYFLMWICLEMNMMMFLPIMSSESGLALENAMKYFLLQSWASIIYLTGLTFSFFFFNSNNLLLILSMMMKLGSAPFHGWFISIIKSSSLWILFLLSTIQKLIPLFILSNLNIENSLMMFFLLITSLFVVLMIPSVMNLTKMLGISSLTNLNWFIMSSQISAKIMIIYFSIYFILMLSIVFIYNNNGTNSLIQMNNMNNFDKMILIFILMSLGGLPPFLGFLSKVLVLKLAIYMFNYIFLLIMIYTSLMILYCYISRFFFLLTYSPKIKFDTKNFYSSKKKIIFLMTILFFNMLMMIYI
uniref:NADH-ubiquinone oxidoreductase chain 2 n=1 Tax=Undinula vulgaris TaxID=184747 RepID=A0A6B9D692_UNDVU|nr:NADH dehydrogenase subunit 2 [Undinula vulgaris]